jgi:hypothetical protein
VHSKRIQTYIVIALAGRIVALVVVVVGRLATKWSVDEIRVGVGADGGQELPRWRSSVRAGRVGEDSGASVGWEALIEMSTLNKQKREHFSRVLMRLFEEVSLTSDLGP